MKFGIVGLGRMGSNLALHALERGHEVVGYSDESAPSLHAGIHLAGSYDAFAAELQGPRLALVYVPHGEATQDVVEHLAEVFEPGDLVIDGGNSHWRDSSRTGEALAKLGIRFLDVGTSGGVVGARTGACFMVGGDPDAFEVARPLLEDLAVDPDGVTHVGPSGAGHFVKLVHNAIEFGMVQAIAEGVELLARTDYPLDLAAVVENWAHGSVIRSWLLDLMGEALRGHDLATLSTYVEDTGEVKWLIRWASDADIPLPVVTAAQTALMQYRDSDAPQAKAHALLRNAFGEHPLHVREHPTG